jgi:FkbM family methyltransferase
MSEDLDERLISYSINAEDVVLRRVFGGRRTGFFVDVGAEDPVNGNDFFGLYLLGWRGINIEPNPAYLALLQEKRPEDLNLQVLVSDTTADALPFYIVEGTGLSTCDAAMAEQHAGHQAAVHRVEMRATTLAAILEQAGAPTIDVLKIDVEGFEEKVLHGNDWARFRPSVIMLEVTLPQSPVRRQTGITAYLAEQGYRFAYHDGLNDFFVERDFVAPADSFRAPNVFDNVVRWETIALRENYDALRSGFVDVEQYAKALEGEREITGEALSATNRSLAEEQRRRRQVADALETTQRVAIRLLDNDDDGVDMILGGTDQTVDAAMAPAIGTGRELVVLEGQSATPDADATVADTHLEMLRARLGSLQRERNALAQQVKDLEIQNRRLAAGNAQLQGERLALHRALDGQRAQSHVLVEARRALEGLRGLVEDESASRTEKASAVAARLERANAEAARIERDNEAAALQQSEQVEQARRDRVSQRYGGVRPAQDGDAAMIEALYASTSWKLTRPVRAFGRLLGSKKV